MEIKYKLLWIVIILLAHAMVLVPETKKRRPMSGSVFDSEVPVEPGVYAARSSRSEPLNILARLRKQIMPCSLAMMPSEKDLSNDADTSGTG